MLITHTQYKDNEAFAGYSNNYTLRAKVFRNGERAETDTIVEIYFYLTKSISYRKKLFESEIRKQNGIKVNERISITLKKITINKDGTELIRHITEQLPQHKENTYTFLNNSEILETLEKSTEFYIKETDEF